jgi:hypothetical protein
MRANTHLEYCKFTPIRPNQYPQRGAYAGLLIAACRRLIER